VRLRAWVRGRIVVRIVVRGHRDRRGVGIARWEVVRVRMAGATVGVMVGGVMVAGARTTGLGIADPIGGRVVRDQTQDQKGAKRVRMDGAMIVDRRRRGCVPSRGRLMMRCRISQRLVGMTSAVVPIVVQIVVLKVAAVSRAGLAGWVAVVAVGVVVGRAGLLVGHPEGTAAAGPTGRADVQCCA